MSTIHSTDPKVSCYHILIYDKVKVQSSSFQTRLELIDLGVKPINNRVDIANLFMYHYGQPIHCFDAGKITGTLRARFAQSGESFVDLNGKTHTLMDQDLVIADDIKICALAGIIGSADTAVCDQTTRIMIEIANFDPVVIRKTGVRYGLRTDAELRFEKKINPAWTAQCVNYLQEHLQSYQQDLGSLHHVGTDQVCYPYSSHRVISFDIHDMQSFVFGSLQVPDDFLTQAKQILIGLGGILDTDGDNWSYTPSVMRGLSDLSLPEDLREEVSRLYGYDRISGLSLGGAIKYLPLNPTIILQQSVESYLIQACHFDQVETYSWVHDHLAYRFGIQLAHQPTLINPVTPEKSHLRSNLLCGLYEVIVRNFRHDDHIHICEIGKVWHESQELTSLAIMIYHKDVSNRSQDAWLSAKGIIQGMIDHLHLSDIDYRVTALSSAHPTKQASIYQSDCHIGDMYQFHPLMYIDDKISQSSQIVYAEIILDHVKTTHQTPSFATLDDPVYTKELCFVVPRSADTSLLAMSHIPEIKHYHLYDIYDLGDTKSVTFSYRINSSHPEQIMDRIIADASKHGFVLRK